MFRLIMAATESIPWKTIAITAISILCGWFGNAQMHARDEIGKSDLQLAVVQEVDKRTDIFTSKIDSIYTKLNAVAVRDSLLMMHRFRLTVIPEDVSAGRDR